MADTLLFRGGATTDVNASTVQSREIVIDTDTDQIVSGPNRLRTVMVQADGYIDDAHFTGNVGIGTTNPAKLLDVRADASINGLNVGRGAGGLQSNTVFGIGALTSNTSGNYNIAIGLNVLQTNTTGSNNTGIGQGCFVNNTTGAANTALGRQALTSNTEGSGNTALGRLALQSNVIGSYNTAVGRNAGNFIQGSNNTILGAYSGTAADATLNDTVIISSGLTERMRIKSDGTVNFSYAAVYADNTAALAGGLVAGDVYRKADGTLMITF